MITLEDLFTVLREDQFIGLSIRGNFHLSEDATVKELIEEIENLNGKLDRFEIQSIEKGEDDIELFVIAYDLL